MQSQWAPTTATQLYVNTQATSQIIDKFTAYNADAASQTLTVYIVPSGGTLDTSYTVLVIPITSLQSYLCGELVGHDLDPGDSIWCAAGTISTISVRCSGRTR